MSKHFSLFQTESQYQAAKNNLDYPHVSLIDTTGDLHYFVYHGKEVADAPFGSILMAEVSTDKLFYIDNAYYNLTDYPLESYKPIAVCIYDRASNANEQTVFMAVQWADYTDLGTPKASSKGMSWGFNNVDLSQSVTGIRDKTNHISSIAINNSVKTLITKNYSGSSITDTYGDGESTACCVCWRFKTVGTKEGEWYLPSYYDLSKYSENTSTINNILDNIKTVAGSSYLNNTYVNIWTACEVSKNKAVPFTSTGVYGSYDKSNKNAESVRPVFIVRIEEL